jgi:hypothetical protein
MGTHCREERKRRSTCHVWSQFPLHEWTISIWRATPVTMQPSAVFWANIAAAAELRGSSSVSYACAAVGLRFHLPRSDEMKCQWKAAPVIGWTQSAVWALRYLWLHDVSEVFLDLLFFTHVIACRCTRVMCFHKPGFQASQPKPPSGCHL